MAEEVYWVYILECDNKSLYTGYTNDLWRRYQDHQAGKCKYTRSFKPRAIAQAWKIFGTKANAMKIEHYIKQLARHSKLRLVQNPQMLTEAFAGQVSIVIGNLTEDIGQ